MELPNKKYQIIYADPPWDISYVSYKHHREFLVGQKPPYKTMSDDEIIHLPIKKIVDDDAVLFLWVVDSRIPLIEDIMSSWGFEYKGVAFVWNKICKYKRGENCTYGGHTRRSCEFCFIGICGKSLIKCRNIKQYIGSPRREHSRKPDIVRTKIVEMCGNVPRIELFARNRFDGWDTYGDQLSNTIQKLIT